MNERILELASEAEDYADGIADQGGEFHEEYTKKLAELIVRECADLNFRSTGHVTTDGEIAIGDMIRNHFGVE